MTELLERAAVQTTTSVKHASCNGMCPALLLQYIINTWYQSKNGKVPWAQEFVV